MAKLKTGIQTARLIVINFKDEKYNIVPGGETSEFVSVPDDVLELSFVDNLIRKGVLVAALDGESSVPSDNIDELREEAEALGVKVDKRWKASRLRLEIDAAKE